MPRNKYATCRKASTLVRPAGVPFFAPLAWWVDEGWSAVENWYFARRPAAERRELRADDYLQMCGRQDRTHPLRQIDGEVPLRRGLGRSGWHCLWRD